MKSVTINLSSQDHYTYPRYNLPEKGSLIKYSNKKRYYMEVMGINNDEPYTHTLNCRMGYKPAPKSQLRHKRPFSFFKARILN